MVNPKTAGWEAYNFAVGGCGVMLRWRAQVCLAFPESLLTCAGGYERQTWK
jgi:hypothetical protein